MKNKIYTWSFLLTLGLSGLMLSGFTTPPPSHAAQTLPEFTELVQAYRPAVVNISTTQKQAQRRFDLRKHFGMPDLPEDSPFHDFFRQFPFFEEEGEGGIEKFETHSLGSGFIISEDGYVISNHHVVKDADEIIVRLSDRREFEAEVVGVDEKSDISLLKIDADDLPTVELGVGEDVEVGEWVLAIGSPFGFDHSVTAGIVSAKGRNLPSENYVPFIQTDVAINPGNSGGPLFNLDGKVIGVNAQIFSRSGGFMGLAFAIPIDVAMDVANQIREQGHVSRGWLGVLIQDVTRELAESFGMEKPMGALVAKVLPEGPAMRAGMKVGDIILEFGGRDIHHSSNLPPMVGGSKVGSRVPTKILRNSKSKILYVVIDELPADDAPRLAGKGPSDTAADNRLRLTVRDLTPKQQEEYELEDRGGVFVEKVDEGPAREASIRVGDIILRINNLEVENTLQFKQLAKELPFNRAIPVLVQRHRNPLFLALKILE
uniref:Probable periplasmic serine endoprotease DegP-like n=1 Tax=Candidatus Kentrum eta TaxID=2126337 RepID=A0A450V7Q0_9GAMM|nr:MAG: serine protease Do [Candidatus Kentron sp. H]VFK00852.1 MAG: serine protease Do [Candidatus Kentron sp. H]VFK04754.1 MAG: serine protease Do [Candidatus Kentron sp. H]